VNSAFSTLYSGFVSFFSARVELAEVRIDLCPILLAASQEERRRSVPRDAFEVGVLPEDARVFLALFRRVFKCL
jgi:hypothetical protein